MKRVVPDLVEALKSKFVAQLNTVRKLSRYWGTETKDGVEVFTAKNYYYPNMGTNVEKLGKLLGIGEELGAKQKGIRSAWLYLNPTKTPDNDIVWDGGVLSRNLNKAIEKIKGRAVTSVSISSRRVLHKFVSPGITTPVDDQEGIIAEITAGFTGFWDEGFSIFSNHEDPYASLILLYMLKSTTFPYTVSGVRLSTTEYVYPINNGGSFRSTKGPVWTVDLDVDFEDATVSPTSDIIDKIISDATNPDNATSTLVRSMLLTASQPLTSEDGDPVDNGYPDGDETNDYEDVEVALSSYWIKDGKFYLLKKSFLDAPGITREEKIKYIVGCIDTGYSKKKMNWFQAALAIIVIAVAAFFSYGAALKLGFGSGFFGTVMTVAVTMSVASMYVSLAMAAASILGAQNLASAMGAMLQRLDPLIKIANILALVASIARLAQAARASLEEAARTAATEAGTEVVEVTTREVLVETIKSLTTSMTGITKLTDMSLEHVIRMADVAFGMYQKNQVDGWKRQEAFYRKELAELQQAKEASETSDILKEFIVSQPRVLASDNSVYAEHYDKPYEHWSTPYHTGNIQATTVSALWLTRD